MIALDLFSGTGGATAAFRSRRAWRVVTVELDPRLPSTVRADVRHLPISGPVDFLWASPPCTEFSTANPRVDHSTKRPSLELVVAVLRTVRDLRPRFWIMENVRGAIPFLGIPAQKIGPFCLWGYFPPIEVSNVMATYRKWDKKSAVARAAIPLELSEAVACSVERYWDHPSILDMRTIRPHRNVRSSTTTNMELPL